MTDELTLHKPTGKLIIQFGNLTPEETAAIVKRGLDELDEDHAIDLIVEYVLNADDYLTDEIVARLDDDG